jgi:hypothetical protein
MIFMPDLPIARMASCRVAATTSPWSLIEDRRSEKLPLRLADGKINGSVADLASSQGAGHSLDKPLPVGRRKWLGRAHDRV